MFVLVIYLSFFIICIQSINTERNQKINAIYILPSERQQCYYSFILSPPADKNSQKLKLTMNHIVFFVLYLCYPVKYIILNRLRMITYLLLYFLVCTLIATQKIILKNVKYCNFVNVCTNRHGRLYYYFKGTNHHI